MKPTSVNGVVNGGCGDGDAFAVFDFFGVVFCVLVVPVVY